MSNMDYQFLHHLDASRRILTLTMDELLVAVLGFVLLIVSSQKILVALFGLGLLSGLRFLKRGQGARFLLVLAYWHLPSAFTQFFLPQLPRSYQRIYLV